jgi:hypothetical protein
MNQLLGQVAAGGGATGAMMAEGLGGMFGLSTKEEQKAAELQAMAENMDLNTSTGLAEFAKALNGLGYTKEAIQILEKRDSVLDRERRMTAEDKKSALDKAMREGKIREGVPRPTMRVRLDSKGNPVMGPNGQPMMERVLEKTYERWDEAQMKWVSTDAPAESTSSSGFGVEWDKLLTGTTEEPTQATTSRTRPNMPSTEEGRPQPRSLSRR